MCSRGASLGGALHARPNSWSCSSSSGKDRSILGLQWLLQKNGADALDDKYSSEAAFSPCLSLNWWKLRRLLVTRTGCPGRILYGMFEMTIVVSVQESGRGYAWPGPPALGYNSDGSNLV